MNSPNRLIGNNGYISGKQPVWPDVAILIQVAVLKITDIQGNCIFVPDMLTCNQAQNHITSFQIRQDQRRSAFAAGQIGKWKRDDNHITFYKFAHALSSSVLNQSFDRLLSATRSISFFDENAFSLDASRISLM